MKGLLIAQVLQQSSADARILGDDRIHFDRERASREG
jgi:hypothetical protein